MGGRSSKTDVAHRKKKMSRSPRRRAGSDGVWEDQNKRYLEVGGGALHERSRRKSAVITFAFKNQQKKDLSLSTTPTE